MEISNNLYFIEPIYRKQKKASNPWKPLCH
nr:MAG TPA: hypothetical protein [Bacteriophage sp.]